MILVLENEVDPDARYFVEELRRYLPAHRVYDYVKHGGSPDLHDVDGVIVAGSTAGVYEADDHTWMADERELIRRLVEERVPTLGVCFGHQLVNQALGGTVEHRELHAELVRTELDDVPVFDGVNPTIPAVHGDFVTALGDDMETIASADYYEHFATAHRDAPLWTVQYHPEFTTRLKGRIADDFGWTENDLSFGECNPERTLENFVRLAIDEA